MCYLADSEQSHTQKQKGENSDLLHADVEKLLDESSKSSVEMCCLSAVMKSSSVLCGKPAQCLLSYTAFHQTRTASLSHIYLHVNIGDFINRDNVSAVRRFYLKQTVCLSEHVYRLHKDTSIVLHLP